MTTPTAPHPSGYWTLLTSGLTALIVVIGTLLIQPRLSERRLNIDDQYILTATEVRSLPAGTLAVVLDRSPGENHSDFKYRLLELVLQRSGRPYVLGSVKWTSGRMKPLQRWNRAIQAPVAIPSPSASGSTGLGLS